ncbi:hypothetical protein ACFLXT_05015 [Chloroflexota bacterium]
MIPEPDGYMYSWELVDWAQANLKITRTKEALTNEDIRRIIRWIGTCTIDTIFIDGDKPIISRIGIGLMLSVTLLEFPEYYVEYELSQFN